MDKEANSKSIFLALQEQLNKSDRDIKMLEPASNKVDMIKAKYKIPENTLFGAILYNSGGIIFDGWIRLLGSGERDIATWNETLNLTNCIVVADDVLGGIFALDTTDNIIYFAPDTLEWEEMGVTYTQLIRWMAEGDVYKFYELFRWDNWKNEVCKLSFSEGIGFYPFLWAKSEQERHRTPLPLSEIVLLSFDMKKQLGL